MQDMDTQSDVDPLTAPVADRFVIQQHHATALHHDVRLEMMKDDETPVLVSWAVPKGLPRRRGVRHLAIRTPDHSMEHLAYEGRIPDDEYGAGVVRIYDEGNYEMIARSRDRLTFRLDGRRLRGIWHLVSTGSKDGREHWLALLSEDLRAPVDVLPAPEPMIASRGEEPFDDPGWVFEPRWAGLRVMAFCEEGTRIVTKESEEISALFPEMKDLNRRLIVFDAVVDGVVVAFENGLPSASSLQRRLQADGENMIDDLAKRSPVVYMVFDLLYMDGRNVMDQPLDRRRSLLEDALVPAPWVQLSPVTEGEGILLALAVAQQGLEGLVAKRRSSPYEQGLTTDWLLL